MKFSQAYKECRDQLKFLDSNKITSESLTSNNQLHLINFLKGIQAISFEIKFKIVETSL